MQYSPENGRRAVERKAPHAHRNRDGNLYVRYLYWNGDRWDWNDNWLDNDWNSDNPAACGQPSSFLLPIIGRGSFVS